MLSIARNDGFVSQLVDLYCFKSAVYCPAVVFAMARSGVINTPLSKRVHKQMISVRVLSSLVYIRRQFSNIVMKFPV